MTPGRPDFFTAVYAVVARIPAGQVATYGLVAFLAGRPRASRIVGCALARAPEGLPCHRVLLLEGEGVPFLPDGRVDLSRCLWDGGEERSTL